MPLSYLSVSSDHCRVETKDTNPSIGLSPFARCEVKGQRLRSSCDHFAEEYTICKRTRVEMERAVLLCVLLGLLVCGAHCSGNCDFRARGTLN